MNEESIVVGFVRGAHGVSGEFKVESASGHYEHIEKLAEVTLRRGDIEKKCKVESARKGNCTLFMKLAEINTPEEVRKYNGWEIEVPKKYAHPLEKDEWYFKDLKGCSLVWSGNGTAAIAAQQEIVGTVTDVLEGGAGYLLEVSLSESCSVLADNIKYTSSGKTRKVFIPFSFQYVNAIDVKNKTIQLMHLWILE